MFYNSYLLIKYNVYINVKIYINVKVYKYIYNNNNWINFQMKRINENDIINSINEI